MLTGIFTNAKVLDNEFIYSWDSKIAEQNNVLGESIEILSTPGHDPFHLSVLFKDENAKNIVIAGDIFWWWDSEKQLTDEDSLINKEDPFVKDLDKLIDSRKKILKIADYIIPGHGKPFDIKH